MTRLNKGFYLGSHTALFVLAMVLSGVVVVRLIELGALHSSIFSQAEIIQLVTELIVEVILLILLFVAGSVVYLTLVYKMWSSIQDGHARTSPGKAVGFLFIPFFGAYWFFQVWWGFAKDYNAYLKRHALQLRELSEGLFLSFNILPFLFWIPFLGWAGILVANVIFLFMVSSVCDRVNALPNEPSLGGNHPVFSVLGLQEYPRTLSLNCVSGEFGGNQLEVPSGGLVIGRNPSRANLVLASDEVSGAHVRVWPDLSGSGLWIEDMHSTNGTYYCDGGRGGELRRWTELRGQKMLSNGAHFRIGCGVAEFEVRRA